MCSEKSDCMVDNTHLKICVKYAEYLLSLYKAQSPFNQNGSEAATGGVL